MLKALFIVGPTAVGKTALAVDISRGIPSILISADSIQVYRGADVISGKDHPEDINIELVDSLPPAESFNVRDFTDQVRLIIDRSTKENKLPIIVGGTGLYVSSLFKNIKTINIPPDENLRNELATLSLDELKNRLGELDVDKLNKMNNSDVNNPRRLIRAIEVGMVDHSNYDEAIFSLDEALIIGLETGSDDLRKRIETRVKQRIDDGALDEAKKLFENYDNLSPQLKVANGYKEMFLFLMGNITWEEAVDQWITADYQHVKAQLTWFRKDKNINWFDIESEGFKEDILKLIRSALSVETGTK